MGNRPNQIIDTIERRSGEDAVFVDFIDTQLGYRELWQDIRKLCGYFRSLDLNKGDRLLIQTAEDRHAITILLAALLDGLVPVVLTADTPAERGEGIARIAGPRHLFMDKPLVLSRPWLKDYRHTPIAVETQGRALLNRLFQKRQQAAAAASYPGIIAEQELVRPSCAAQDQDLAYILFTSGTTDAPKGVMISHDNIWSHLATLSSVFDYDEGSVILNAMVLAHADGLVQGPLLTVFNGCRLLRPQPFSLHNLEGHLELVRSKAVTHFLTVPTILALIDHYTSGRETFAHDGFKHVVSVAAKLDSDLWLRLEERFERKIANIYGLTETVTGGIFCMPQHPRVSGAIGEPVDMQVRIVDPERLIDVAPGEVGELWMRGANATPGYYGNAQATSDLYHEGWLRTGDLAARQPDGTLTIRGRIKAVIISGGFNIYPEEVNEALCAHPSIREAATLGLADPDWGEVPVSAVIAHEGLSEADLIGHARGRLEERKVPKTILFFDEFPRGDAGKPQLKLLRAEVERRLEAGKQAADGIDSEIVLDLAAEVFKATRQGLSLDHEPAMVPGWDSFGHINLVMEAEKRFGVRLDARAVVNIASLRDLHAALNASGARR